MVAVVVAHVVVVVVVVPPLIASHVTYTIFNTPSMQAFPLRI
jgi:hypothetical protein